MNISYVYVMSNIGDHIIGGNPDYIMNFSCGHIMSSRLCHNMNISWVYINSLAKCEGNIMSTNTIIFWFIVTLTR